MRQSSCDRRPKGNTLPSPSVEKLSRSLYAGHRTESEQLDDVIRRHLGTGRVLDIGCGGGKLYAEDYRAPGRTVVGIDLDSSLSENALIEQRVHGSAAALPFANDTFDVVYSRYVCEHLEEPEAVFAEVSRVLRPNGVMVALTPSVFHYVALISRLTPDWFHGVFNERLRGRKRTDTFPVRYRANSRRALRRLAAGAGLAVVELRMIETRPNYLLFALLPFLAGVAYERIVNATELLSALRVNILATFRKPAC